MKQVYLILWYNMDAVYISFLFKEANNGKTRLYDDCGSKEYAGDF